MNSNHERMNNIVKAENVRVVLGAGNIIAIVVATWAVSNHLSDIKHDISDFRNFTTEMRKSRDEDRAQMKEFGDKLVAAINRITAIEARTERK